MKNIILFTVLLAYYFGNVLSAPLGNSGENDNVLPVNNLISSAKDFKSNLLTPTERTRETAKLEKEDLPSAILTVYDNTQMKATDALNVKPIIDTIEEHEKYGNEGGPFPALPRAIVNGYEAFSNFMNKVLDTPGNLIRGLSKSINVHLDNIGGRIVGLN